MLVEEECALPFFKPQPARYVAPLELKKGGWVCSIYQYFAPLELKLTPMRSCVVTFFLDVPRPLPQSGKPGVPTQSVGARS